MSLHALKPRFQALLRPTAHTLYRLGLSANQVTVVACGVSLLIGCVLSVAVANGELRWLLVLPPWLLARMALNAMDGMLAREFGQVSPLGGYLNELSDLLADAVLYLPFALLAAPGSALLTGALIVLANVAEMAGALAMANRAERRNDGPMGKSDRALALGTLALLLGGGVAPGLWSSAALMLIVLLLLPTIATRVRRGLAAGAAAGPRAE